MQGLIESKTFAVVDELPHGKTPVRSRWVLSYKSDKDGQNTKKKARLVAKGGHAERGRELPSKVFARTRSGISQNFDGCCQ